MMRAMLFSRSRILLLCLIANAPVAAGALAPTVMLEAMTWTEVRAALDAGRTTILVPIGGTEQNGAHMALGKHNRRVQLLAEKIAQSLGNALVAPVVAYVPEGAIDPPTGHMRYAGTISVPSEAFIRVLAAAARSFRRHGFRDIVFLGDSGDYQVDLKSAADSLNRGWRAQPVRAHALPEYYLAGATAFPELLRKRGFPDDEIGTHAGLADTSLMLALDPGLVRSDRLAAAFSAGRPDGSRGDPRRASAELGQLGVELIVAQSVRAIRNAESRPAPTPR